MKKTILLTGSSGFLGNFFLKRALKKNYKVIDILRIKNKDNKKLNYLRKKFKTKYKTIFYKSSTELKKKLSNIKIDYFINFATLYKDNHDYSDIPKFIESNITFPISIIDQIYEKVSKIINFGTMMQHLDGQNFIPKNFYASTKTALEMMTRFYVSRNKKLKFYNLKFYESFHELDNRKKLIPTLLKNYKKNLTTIINSKKLEINILHLEDIFNAIDIILKKDIKSGSYCLQQKKNIKIVELIKKINLKTSRSIKVKFKNDSLNKIILSKLKKLNKWKPKANIEKKIIEEFKK